jgi:hypothetical protein
MTRPLYIFCACPCGCTLPLRTAREVKSGKCKWCWQGQHDKDPPHDMPGDELLRLAA